MMRWGLALLLCCLNSCSDNEGPNKGYEDIHSYLQDGYWVKDSIGRGWSENELKNYKVYEFHQDTYWSKHFFIPRWNSLSKFRSDQKYIASDSFLYLPRNISGESVPDSLGFYRSQILSKDRIRLEAGFDSLEQTIPPLDSIMVLRRIYNEKEYLNQWASNVHEVDMNCEVKRDSIYGLWKKDSVVSQLSSHSVEGDYVFFGGDGEVLFLFLEDRSTVKFYPFNIDGHRVVFNLNSGPYPMRITCLKDGELVLIPAHDQNEESVDTGDVEVLDKLEKSDSIFFTESKWKRPEAEYYTKIGSSKEDVLSLLDSLGININDPIE